MKPPKMIKALLASRRSLDEALELASQISVASEREIAIQHPALDPYKDDKLKGVD